MDRRHSPLVITVLVLLVLALGVRAAWNRGWRLQVVQKETSESTQRLLPQPSATPDDTQSDSWAYTIPLTSTSSVELARILAHNQMPPCDYVALARDLRGIRTPIPKVVRDTPLSMSVGDQQRFWVGDVDKAVNREVTATLRVLTEHLQMWVQDEAPVNVADLENSAQAFEEHIYPTNHKYFGWEWSSGVDGDVRLVVLNARFTGAAGYFAAANEYSRLVNPYSNEHEMFVMNLDALDPGTQAYEDVLAHEFQHMVHWNVDRNEDAWLNEGASELAEDLNGYPQFEGSLRYYEEMPSVQLNTWSDDEGETGAHYGASYLVLRYFLERFGPEMFSELIRDPNNGLASFEAVLKRYTTAPTLEEFYADWLVANALDDPEWGDGRYAYKGITVSVTSQYEVDTYPYDYTSQLPQYGAHYVDLIPEDVGPLRVSFAGTPEVKLVPNDPTSGHYEWWSNRGDSSHSYLERHFDLTHVTTATLVYNLWYDIEDGWDYAYVRASTDGGVTWELLPGAQMTDTNPSGNALGPGYTGKSGGTPDDGADPVWVREELDLGPYCGQKVLIRFDYVTDDSINRPGLCLDDLDLSVIGFEDDVEAGEGAWHAEGFIRHANRLPQRYLVQAIEFADIPRLSRMSVGGDGQGEWIFPDFGDTVGEVLLIISPLAPVTTEAATYSLGLEQLTQPDGERILLAREHGTQVQHDPFTLHTRHDSGVARAQSVR
jgi:immune inhibitor A